MNMNSPSTNKHKWLYGTIAVLLLVIFLGGGGGWRYYQKELDKQIEHEQEVIDSITSLQKERELLYNNTQDTINFLKAELDYYEKALNKSEATARRRLNLLDDIMSRNATRDTLDVFADTYKHN